MPGKVPLVLNHGRVGGQFDWGGAIYTVDFPVSFNLECMLMMGLG